MGLEVVALSYQMHVGQHEISFGPKATTRARTGNRNAGMRADRPEMVLFRHGACFQGQRHLVMDSSRVHDGYDPETLCCDCSQS